jgi:hypothetical protein
VVAAVVSMAAWRGADLVYVTDGVPPEPWGGLPAYWDREVEAVRRMPSTPPRRP